MDRNRILGQILAVATIVAAVSTVHTAHADQAAVLRQLDGNLAGIQQQQRMMNDLVYGAANEAYRQFTDDGAAGGYLERPDAYDPAGAARETLRRSRAGQRGDVRRDCVRPPGPGNWACRAE